MKKDLTDGLMQIAILLSLLRIDLNSFLTSDHVSYPEIHDIILGPISGLTHTHIHNNYNYHSELRGYSHPKNLDNVITSSIFRDLHSLGTSSRFLTLDTSINAYLVGDPDLFGLQNESASSSGGTPNGVSPSDNNNNNNDTFLMTSAQASQINNTDHNSASAIAINSGIPTSDIPFPSHLEGAELTKEDMDLIEVLWRQDIDLGVEREVYDLNRQKELEKERELELHKLQEKEKELFVVPEETECVPSHLANYTIDGETGELVPLPAVEHELPPIPNVTTHLVQQQEQQILQQPLPSFHQENLITSPLSDEEGLSIEDAMRILELTHGGLQGVAPVATESQLQTQSHQQLPPVNQTQQLQQELQQLVATQAQPSFTRQTSFEQRWQDVASLLDPTTSHAQGNGQSPLVQNASFAAPVSNNVNFSFMQELASVQNATANANHSGMFSNNSQPDNVYLNMDSLESLFPALPNASVNNSLNSTETLLNQLLSSTNMPEMMEMNVTKTDPEVPSQSERLDPMDDASSDSGYSAIAGSAASPVSVANKDIIDGQSNMTDSGALEGATGGSESDDDDDQSVLSGFGNKYEKYEPDYEFGQMGEDDDKYHSNTSMSSNDTDFRLSHTLANPHHISHNHSYPLQSGQETKERRKNGNQSIDEHPLSGRSRDNKKAKALNLPFSTDEIISCSVERFNDMLTKYKLTESQLQLLRDIRRRGKNKVAAQNCRKRKLDVIQDLDGEVQLMQQERDELRNERQLLEKAAEEMKDKYNHLYREVFTSLRDEHGDPYDPSQFTLEQTGDGNVFLVPVNGSMRLPHMDDSKQKTHRKRKTTRKD